MAEAKKGTGVDAADAFVESGLAVGWAKAIRSSSFMKSLVMVANKAPVLGGLFAAIALAVRMGTRTILSGPSEKSAIVRVIRDAVEEGCEEVMKEMASASDPEVARQRVEARVLAALDMNKKLRLYREIAHYVICDDIASVVTPDEFTKLLEVTLGTVLAGTRGTLCLKCSPEVEGVNALHAMPVDKAELSSPLGVLGQARRVLSETDAQEFAEWFSFMLRDPTTKARLLEGIVELNTLGELVGLSMISKAERIEALDMLKDKAKADMVRQALAWAGGVVSGMASFGKDVLTGFVDGITAFDEALGPMADAELHFIKHGYGPPCWEEYRQDALGPVWWVFAWAWWGVRYVIGGAIFCPANTRVHRHQQAALPPSTSPRVLPRSEVPPSNGPPSEETFRSKWDRDDD